MSGNTNQQVIKFAFKNGPRRLKRQGTANTANDVAQLVQSFLDPRNIADWLHGGASPRGLIGEIGAMLSSAALDEVATEKLDNVRAFVNHHSDVLHDPSHWPVLHFVEQLASQETDWTFGAAPTAPQTSAHLDKRPAGHTLIERVDTRQGRRAFRWTIRGDAEVKIVAFSPDGSRLARAEGSLVVVCDARTGFLVSSLPDHSNHGFFYCMLCYFSKLILKFCLC